MLTPEQLASRRLGAGGSDVPAILGIDSFRGPLDVYLNKLEEYDQPSNPDMERGTFLEGGMVDWYAHRLGCAEIREPGSLVMPAHPIARCTPDRLVLPHNPVPGGGHSWHNLSIKVPRRAGREDWGDEGGDHVPLPYFLQVQWELMILGALQLCRVDWAHLAALVDGDLRVFTVRGDHELQRELLLGVEAWWKRHVVAKVPPEMDGSESATAWIKRRFPADWQPARPATAQEEVLVQQLKEAIKAHAETEEAQDAAKNRIREVIGSGSGIESTAGRVTWKANAKGTRVLLTPREWKK